MLSRTSPRQEDVKPLLRKWGVAQMRNRTLIPLPEMVQEFRGKVVEAARKRQQQLLDSAERPAAQPASTEAPRPDVPWLAALKERQRQRAGDEALHTPPKLHSAHGERQKRSAHGNRQSPAKRLAQMLFEASACDPSDSAAASAGGAAQPSMLQQQGRLMQRVAVELKKLQEDGWIFGQAADQLKKLISQARELHRIPAIAKILRKPSIRSLYTSICGPLNVRTAENASEQQFLQQNMTHVSLTASYALEAKVAQFLQTREDMQDMKQDLFPTLWELKNRSHDAALNGFSDMPKAPQDLMKALQDTGLPAGAPFGRLPRGAHDKHPEYFVRMLACLELSIHLPLEQLPALGQHAQLIEKVVQHRADAANTSAAHPAPVTVSDIRDVMQDFASDSFSGYAKKRWLWSVLRVPHKSRPDPECLPQIFQTAVEEFLHDVPADLRTGFARSKHTLAALALYHRILTIRQAKIRGPMSCGPVLRLLANAAGTNRKPYLPADQCGKDVELAANRMPAYWTRLQDSAAQPADDLFLPVASPPVMCWICGEGFLHNGALFKHCMECHGDYAEYRKRLFWRAQKDGFKPLLPWVKRHMLANASFHATYSVPGSFSLKWNHPEAFRVAKERCEVACVVCARKDWLESRFSVYLWREATGSTSYSELRHNDSGNSQLLTHGEHLCFGNRDVIDTFLNTQHYREKFPRIPPEHLYASSALHPKNETMAWLLHTRRVPLLPDSRKPPQSSAEESASQPASSAAQPVMEHKCAGVGDINQVAHICYDCATCLCVEEKLIKMPKFALSNAMWLGREHPLLQDASLGTRLLLGHGRPCFRKFLLGRGHKQDRESGTTGNHVLVSQGAPSIGQVLPPSSQQLSQSFVAVFGQDKEDLSKCQVLTVNREAYRILVQERVRVNSAFVNTVIDEEAVERLPEHGVPQQLIECGVQMKEVDRYAATRCGPGTVRDPLEATAEADAASDEGSEAPSDDADAGQPAADAAELHLNQFETPLGLDPTSTPDFVQHVAAFKTQLDLVQSAVKQMRSAAQPRDTHDTQPADVSAATARAAAGEECFRAVVDLREVAKKLDQHNFQDKVKLLHDADNKAMFVPSNKLLSMFDPATWTKCLSEWWYGDGLPNMSEQKQDPKLSYEQLFETLPDREELEYQLDSDITTYCARWKSRFDTPEHAIIFGDTLRRLLLFRGTKMALRRKGFQKDVRLIANSSSEQCMEVLQDRAGGSGDAKNATMEALSNDAKVAAELRTALRQVLISTKDVPLTDGYKRGLRHESHNLNVAEGSLAVFATFNFADNYSPLLFQLVRGGPGGAVEQIGEDIKCRLTDDAPNMPSLQKMHQLIAQSPRAQALSLLLSMGALSRRKSCVFLIPRAQTSNPCRD